MALRVVDLGLSGSNIDLVASLLDGNPYSYPLAWRTQPGGQWFIGFQLFSMDDEQFMLPVYGPLTYDEFKEWVAG